MELTLQEVFDEVCPSEEEEAELWPSEVNLEGAEDWRGMDVDGFVKAGGGLSGKRKGNRSRDASSDPPTKKAKCKDQVTKNI